jgi:transcription initiation factor TFIID subunit 6
VLKTLRSPPDYIEEYKQEYGYIGPPLCTAVAKARTQPTTIAPATTVSIANNANQQQTPVNTNKTISQAGTFFLIAFNFNQQ